MSTSLSSSSKILPFVDIAIQLQEKVKTVNNTFSKEPGQQGRRYLILDKDTFSYTTNLTQATSFSDLSKAFQKILNQLPSHDSTRSALYNEIIAYKENLVKIGHLDLKKFECIDTQGQASPIRAIDTSTKIAEKMLGIKADEEVAFDAQKFECIDTQGQASPIKAIDTSAKIGENTLGIKTDEEVASVLKSEASSSSSSSSLGGDKDKEVGLQVPIKLAKSVIFDPSLSTGSDEIRVNTPYVSRAAIESFDTLKLDPQMSIEDLSKAFHEKTGIILIESYYRSYLKDHISIQGIEHEDINNEHIDQVHDQIPDSIKQKALKYAHRESGKMNFYLSGAFNQLLSAITDEIYSNNIKNPRMAINVCIEDFGLLLEDYEDGEEDVITGMEKLSDKAIPLNVVAFLERDASCNIIELMQSLEVIEALEHYFTQIITQKNKDSKRSTSKAILKAPHLEAHSSTESVGLAAIKKGSVKPAPKGILKTSRLETYSSSSLIDLIKLYKTKFEGFVVKTYEPDAFSLYKNRVLLEKYEENRVVTQTGGQSKTKAEIFNKAIKIAQKLVKIKSKIFKAQTPNILKSFNQAILHFIAQKKMTPEGQRKPITTADFKQMLKITLTPLTVSSSKEGHILLLTETMVTFLTTIIDDPSVYKPLLDFINSP